MSNTPKALAEGLKRWREQDHTVEVLSPWEKLRKNPTRKLAIDCQCHHCMGWDEHGLRPPRIREEIKDCSSTDCPLYNYRPYRSKKM